MPDEQHPDIDPLGAMAAAGYRVGQERPWMVGDCPYRSLAGGTPTAAMVAARMLANRAAGYPRTEAEASRVVIGGGVSRETPDESMRKSAPLLLDALTAAADALGNALDLIDATPPGVLFALPDEADVATARRIAAEARDRVADALDWWA